jgi:hypothetical protein
MTIAHGYKQNMIITKTTISGIDYFSGDTVEGWLEKKLGRMPTEKEVQECIENAKNVKKEGKQQ